MTNSDRNADGTLKADAPPAQLYNVKSDPGQTTNSIRQNPERAETMRKRLHEIIASPDAPAGDGSTVSISPSAPVKTPISWNAEVWGDSASAPASGNHYIHNNKKVWLLALGRNGSFPGASLTLQNNASVWLSGGGVLGKGVLVLDGGQIQNRGGSMAVVLGRMRVDSSSGILNVEGNLELKTGLSGTGDLRISSFRRPGTSVLIGGTDQGYTGAFVLADSAADHMPLDVEFSTAFPNANLRYKTVNLSRMPVLHLKNNLRFSAVSMPAEDGGLIDLPAGIYDASELKAAGVSGQAVKDCGGILRVGH